MKAIPFQSSLLRKSTVAAAAAFFAVLFVPLPSHAATTTSAGHLKLVSANALLTTRLDSKNARLGERLTAKLTGNVKAADAMELPKGTVLLGKVAHVQPSINNGPSRISVVFNQARLRNGHVIPIKATLLGAYPTSSWNSYDYTGVGGPYIGLHSHYISYDQKVDQEPGTLSHVAMRSAVQSSVSGVFSSKDRNIDLRSGTQLQFAIAPKTKNG